MIAKRAKPTNGKPHKELGPESLHAEQQTLASLLILGHGFEFPEVARLQPRHFLDIDHQRIFAELHELTAAGKILDSTVLAYRLVDVGAFQTHHDAAVCITRLLQSEVTGNGLRTYAEKVRDAYENRCNEQFGIQVVEWTRAGLPPADVRGLIENHLATMDATASRGQRFKKLTAADLDDITDDVPYIVPNVLAEGQPCLCVGGSKMLKTTALVDLVLSSCWPEAHFLGYFQVRKRCRAWFISGESGDLTIAETARRISHAAGRTFRDTQDFFYTGTLPQLNDPADVAELGREISADGINLLVLDPAYLCMDLEGREGSLFAVGKMLRRITEVCAKHGATLILVHHATQGKAKASDFSPPSINDAAWAGFSQHARQWILLGRRETYQDGSGQHRLWLSTGGSAGHGGLYHLDVEEGTRATLGGRFWITKVTPAAQATVNEAEQRATAQVERDQRRVKEHAAKIVDALKHRPSGETTRGLREATSLNGTNFGPAVQHLLDARAITPCEVIKHRKTYDGYKLQNPPKDTERD